MTVCLSCRGADGVHGPGCGLAPKPARPRPASVDEGRCRHELLPGQCAICLGQTGRPEPEFRRRGHAFVAAFPGRCEACPRPIEIGDEITRIVDSSGYAHDSCVPLEAR